MYFRQLREGTLEENRLQDGSRLTLLPSVETGLLVSQLHIFGDKNLMKLPKLINGLLITTIVNYEWKSKL